MVRRKKAKKKRPVWGIPKGIVLLATPEGWRRPSTPPLKPGRHRQQRPHGARSASVMSDGYRRTRSG
ncbi:hypothetical protein [Streptomyces sp. AC555_RSS877]|uniref:hypothetical protein n=1 Tax=Streptomyces sp. AC555_RSS877 TaxID=2823688 RepID=UPI001C2702DE|nr:hypothetical protein [Streptomyces sp. AC555_RSS877]